MVNTVAMTHAMIATMITATIVLIHQLRVTRTRMTHAHSTESIIVDHTLSSRISMISMNSQLTGRLIGGLLRCGKQGAAQFSSASFSHRFCHFLSEAGPEAASCGIVTL